MRVATIWLTTGAFVLSGAAPAWSQEDERRPATTTISGDTGFWFVPTGEVLPPGAASFAAQRTELDFQQGDTSSRTMTASACSSGSASTAV